MNSDDWSIEPFDRRRHDRSEFDCGVPTLNDWLTTKVSQFDRRNISRTYVLVDPSSEKIRGYYALSNHSVKYDSLSSDYAKGLPRLDIPVVLIGRLAVDRAVQGQGLGERLLLDALRRVEFLAGKIGIQAVEVTASSESAKRFYEAHGFQSLQDAPLHLLLSLKAIQRLNLPPL